MDTFETLLEAHLPMLRRLTEYRLPPADAEDVLQEICLAAFRHRDSLRNPSAFRPWICQIARNRIRDYYRAAGAEETGLAELRQRHSAIGRDTAPLLVRETLASLAPADRQILRLYYFDERPVAEIAALLAIPEGTVKSRLHHARERFRHLYPHTEKGETVMKQTVPYTALPEILPDYTITADTRQPFPVVCEELTNWFIIPRVGESVVWGSYDMPERKRTETVRSAVTGKIRIHDVEGVEIETVFAPAETADNTAPPPHIYYAQLTDTHCRWLGECYTDRDGVKRLLTFLDGDDFMEEWGIGEDNCGAPTHLQSGGTILRQGNTVTTVPDKRSPGQMHMDIAGRYTVTLGGQTYDTVLLMLIYPNGAAAEQYIGTDGRTVLWRRFNRDDWHYSGMPEGRWSEHLPENERITIDGEMYVHWYDCLQIRGK